MDSPFPSKLDVFKRIIENKLPESEEIDVGVREQTSELKRSFADKTHHLFEPMINFLPIIEKNYADINNVLYPFALSNENSDKYLVITAMNRDGVATHSHIRKHPEQADGSRIVDCQKIKARRFCDLGLSISKDFLLKVDVDGEDLNVVRGFGELIQDASVIVIEATFRTAPKTLNHIANLGFQLYDIVDLVYYGPGLFQFDIVFVRNDLICEAIRPPIGTFKNDLWQPLQQ